MQPTEDSLLTLRLANSLGQEVLAGRSVHILSNLDLIELEVAVDSTFGNWDTLSPKIRFGLEVNDHSDNSVAPHSICSTRKRTSDRTSRILMAAIILPNEAKAQARLRTRMEAALAEGRRRGLVGEHFAQGLTDNLSMLAEQFGSEYKEQRIGCFKIVATLSFLDGTNISHELRSQALDVEIKDMGTIF